MAIQGSNIASEYLKHEFAMKYCDELEVGESFALAKNEFAFPILRDLVLAKSVGKLCYMVAEWDEVYEVQRLPDGTNAKLAMKYINKPVETAVETSVNDTALRIVKEAFAKGLDRARKYDSTLDVPTFKDGILTYAYLQRRLSSMADFRNYPKGATAGLYAAIASLISAGFAIDISTPTKKMYKFNKDKLNAN